MKILSVSDRVESILYDQFDADLFPGVDLVLSCGDLPPEYLMFLVTKFNVPLFYVKGNHDIRYDSKPPVRCIDLNAKLIQFQGLNLLGLEGSHWYNGGPNQYTEAEMRKTIRLLRPKIWWQGGVDIIITHAPPRHIHDAEDPCHKGFESFRWLIDHYAPSYFIHGHIHMNFSSPSERITTVNRTKVVNSYGYFLFEINDSPTVQ
ncbi:MAG: metallophosphoesterase [Deltaproteobacteria bacterium]|nr:metallophosphoesterase [Deltaproteobacteria bacterium]